MLASIDHERFGGVFFPYPDSYGFFSSPSNIPSALYILHVDREKLLENYALAPRDTKTDPSEISKLENIQEVDSYWRYLRGPRFPIPIPISHCDGNTIDFEGVHSSSIIQTMLNWKANKFPAIVVNKSNKVQLIQEAIGDLACPAILAKNYLPSVREVLTAFEERKTPSEMFKSKNPEDTHTSSATQQITQSIKDYAQLIHMQLEVMQTRHILRRKLEAPFPPDQEEKDLYEVRKLLFQRAIISNWLRSPDLENLPVWQNHEGVSAKEGYAFMEENTSNRMASARAAHLQVAFSASAEATKPTLPAPATPKKSNTKNRDHLRVIRPEDSM